MCLFYIYFLANMIILLFKIFVQFKLCKRTVIFLLQFDEKITGFLGIKKPPVVEKSHVIQNSSFEKLDERIFHFFKIRNVSLLFQ